MIYGKQDSFSNVYLQFFMVESANQIIRNCLLELTIYFNVYTYL